jgi:tRNA pseudouridine38-40 synthase
MRPRSGCYVRATVAYDGTGFCGFQVQAGQRTVQGALEEALAILTQEQIRTIAAGRTDSGAHALGQVVAFYTRWRHALSDLHHGWNALLPDDVVVLSVAGAERGFHPRFSARSRLYRYTIWNHPVQNPLLRHIAHWVAQPLDMDAMAQAACLLVGEHDFATFGQPPQGDSTVRQVLQATWGSSMALFGGDVLHLDIEANAFLYRMVRSIVGTLLQVGTGELSVEQFAARFAAADRSQAGPTAPANGLCLMAIRY